MNLGYQTISNQFYDSIKPIAGPKEIAFYDALLSSRKGPFLEAMCGSGRLLIPLLLQGYAIDGVDSSDAMLASCEQRLIDHGLQAQLFKQSLEQLNLEKQYDVIFIAVGSIQLIEERDSMIAVLRRLHQALLPDGILVLDTFIPWDLIKIAITGECYLSPKPFQIIGSKQCKILDGTITVQSTATVYAHEQVCVTENVYTKTEKGIVCATEDERLAVRWYYRHELGLLLEKIGFSSVVTHDYSFEDNPQAIIYIAKK